MLLKKIAAFFSPPPLSQQEKNQALLAAAQRGDVAACRKLIANGADIDCANNEFSSYIRSNGQPVIVWQHEAVLTRALRHKQPDIVRLRAELTAHKGIACEVLFQ